MDYAAPRGPLGHTAQLGHHVQALLLAQVLGAHDRLLIEQVAGAGLLLEVTLDHVYGPIHLLAGDLPGPLVGDGLSHLVCTSSPRRFGDACNVCSAVPNFRVMAPRVSVKDIFGEHLGHLPPLVSAIRPNPGYSRPTKASPTSRGTTGMVFSARQKSRSSS